MREHLFQAIEVVFLQHGKLTCRDESATGVPFVTAAIRMSARRHDGLARGVAGEDFENDPHGMRLVGGRRRHRVALGPHVLAGEIERRVAARPALPHGRMRDRRLKGL